MGRLQKLITGPVASKLIIALLDASPTQQRIFELAARTGLTMRQVSDGLNPLYKSRGKIRPVVERRMSPNGVAYFKLSSWQHDNVRRLVSHHSQEV